MLHSYVFPGARSNRHPAIPQHPNNLQVITDISYQYAIMVSLSRHDCSVPCEPCAPATRSFYLVQYLHACPSYFLTSRSRCTVLKFRSLCPSRYALFHFPYPVSPVFATLAKTAGCVPTIPALVLTSPLSQKKSALSFHALTWNPFCNLFVFKFTHVMGGCTPLCLSLSHPRALRP